MPESGLLSEMLKYGPEWCMRERMRERKGNPVWVQNALEAKLPPEDWAAAASADPALFWFVPRDMQGKKCILQAAMDAVRKDGRLIKVLPEAMQTFDICLEAFLQNPNVYRSLPSYCSGGWSGEEEWFDCDGGRHVRQVVDQGLDASKKFTLAALKRNPRLLDAVNPKTVTDEAAELALSQVPALLREWKCGSEKVYLKHVGDNPDMMRYVPVELLERSPGLAVQLAAAHPECLESVPAHLKTKDFYDSLAIEIKGTPEERHERDRRMAMAGPDGLKMVPPSRRNAPGMRLLALVGRFFPKKLEGPFVADPPAFLAGADGRRKAQEKASGMAEDAGRRTLDMERFGKACREDLKNSWFREKFNDIRGGKYGLRALLDDSKPLAVCYAAVARNPEELEYVPRGKLTKDMCEYAVRLWPQGLRCCHGVELEPETYLHAVKEWWPSFQYVPARMRTMEMCRSMAAEDSRSLKIMPESMRTEEICMLAAGVPGDFSLAVDDEAVPKQFRAAVRARLEQKALDAVRKEPELLKVLPHGLLNAEICAAAAQNPEMEAFVPRRLLSAVSAAANAPSFLCEAAQAERRAQAGEAPRMHA